MAKTTDRINQIAVNLTEAIDYYHSMDIDPDSDYWQTAWEFSYDLLERALDLPEFSLYNRHVRECESCRENGHYER